MGKTGIQLFDDSRNGLFSVSDLGCDWSLTSGNNHHPSGALFACVNQTNPLGWWKEVNGEKSKKKKNGGGGLKLKIKVANPSLRRLISGAVAGAVSRTVVAPLETIRTHLMVGSGGSSSTEVFGDIMKHEGWTGLFRGNLVNFIRVAPARAVERFVFERVNKKLSPEHGEQSKIPIPASLLAVAGACACAGVRQTLLTNPLELVKTRLTIQRGVYKGIFDAFVKIIREEGPTELYRVLAPRLIGVVPYAATSYFAFLGVAYYNHCKLQALKAKDAQKKVQPAYGREGKWRCW